MATYEFGLFVIARKDAILKRSVENAAFLRMLAEHGIPLPGVLPQ